MAVKISKTGYRLSSNWAGKRLGACVGKGEGCREGRELHSACVVTSIGHTVPPITHPSSQSPESVLGMSAKHWEALLRVPWDSLKFLKLKHGECCWRSCGPALHPFASINPILPTSEMGTMTPLACRGLKADLCSGAHVDSCVNFYRPCERPRPREKNQSLLTLTVSEDLTGGTG